MNDSPTFSLAGENFRQDAAKELVLRPYQERAHEALREGAREHRSQVLYASTGAGKTITATNLMIEAQKKLSRSVFICDRIALIDQTSAMFDMYGIQHGIMQSSHWRTQPWQRTQIASAQTLAKRGWHGESPQLIVVDECHSLYKAVTDFIAAHPAARVVGLSATPFAKGMRKIYSNVVNVATTNQLVDEGYLVPLKCYAGVSGDMKGAAINFKGEWEDAEIETRQMAVVGDIVSEWISKTTLHFGGPVKTICFTPTVSYGEEICRRFQAAGFNFQQVSYLDGNDDRFRELIAEFRKPDSNIVGMVSVEKLAKGYDQPDILCGIFAKPYRKSLTGVIQQLGRVMRPFPGKSYALVLDHSNNLLRFNADIADVFANGISSLDDGEHDAKVRKELDEDEKRQILCRGCGAVMGAAEKCPCCGMPRPRPGSRVQELGGEMVEVSINGKTKALAPWLADRQYIWPQICSIAMERKHGDVASAQKFALAQFRNIYGSWPNMDFIQSLDPIDHKLRQKITSQVIAWAKRRRS